MTENNRPATRRRGRRAKAVAATGAVALLAAAVAAAAFGFGGEARTAVAERKPPATAQVTRATLTETKTVEGNLGYGDQVTVQTGLQGTITYLPAQGVVITRGRAVYSVDADRVPLLYGATPLYRTLQDGVEGQDVKLLEKNLAALGYDGFTVDDEYTWTTREAVERWQEDMGVPVTGKVEPRDAVVRPGPIRVAELKTTLGAAAGGPVLTHTGTTREVTVALDVADQHLVKKGQKATVELPDGSTVQGKVKSIGKVASQTTAQEETTTTVDMVVSVPDNAKLKSFDTTPVEVVIVAEQRKNVLAVPVTALVALAEGGFGVQVLQGSALSYAAVETGMFADGKVEVTGVPEGTTVVVPK
ncbi:peptidoglycan-binding domain-containing protein [Rhizohabitans arisaemae]|uniref:peptidoglycan-binding domain-containing protein n=1 Tax=Rhizohabitans arisaemae TaxID=2720610 RepID=UPI0024B25AFD|nr:peptidoglycan-binding domain-containing protein [Rhizohabitans arisaemae]